MDITQIIKVQRAPMGYFVCRQCGGVCRNKGGSGVKAGNVEGALEAGD